MGRARLVGNCLAIGLAQGFLEPTALHLVLATVDKFMATVDHEGNDEAAHAAFNAAIARRYEGVRDNIVCHYRAARRRYTDYWRDATGHDELSGSLKAIFHLLVYRRDLAEEILNQGIDDIYAPLSWHCLLGGYGNYPTAPLPAQGGVIDMDEVEQFVAGCALNFPTHNDALAELR